MAFSAITRCAVGNCPFMGGIPSMVTNYETDGGDSPEVPTPGNP